MDIEGEMLMVIFPGPTSGRRWKFLRNLIHALTDIQSKAKGDSNQDVHATMSILETALSCYIST